MRRGPTGTEREVGFSRRTAIDDVQRIGDRRQRRSRMYRAGPLACEDGGVEDDGVEAKPLVCRFDGGPQRALARFGFAAGSDSRVRSVSGAVDGEGLRRGARGPRTKGGDENGERQRRPEPPERAPASGTPAAHPRDKSRFISNVKGAIDRAVVVNGSTGYVPATWPEPDQGRSGQW